MAWVGRPLQRKSKVSGVAARRASQQKNKTLTYVFCRRVAALTPDVPLEYAPVSVMNRSVSLGSIELHTMVGSLLVITAYLILRLHRQF